MKTANERIVTCMGCNKRPEQLNEYKMEARINDVTPTQFVIEHEPMGCWGPRTENKFYCTNCYVKAGMPMRRYN